jgi:hypothetical protein
MLTCDFDLIGVSQLMWTNRVDDPKREDETHPQHDERTWKQKVHSNGDGTCFIPPFALKNALECAAKWLSEKLEGRKTFTKRFQSGVLVTEKLPLLHGNGKPVMVDDWKPTVIFAPADGKRGSAKRVDRIFPTLDTWRTSGQVTVYDNKIEAEVIHRHLVAAGRFVGFGAMRVDNGGANGRFGVENFRSEKLEL